MSYATPGWYNDPDDSALIRWWDGGAWTGHTQPHPAASAPVPPPFADAAGPDLMVPPTDDAVPSRRDVHASGSPSYPISEPVRLVPPTSPTAESPPSGWQSSEPPAPSWATPAAGGAAESHPFAAAPLATIAPAPASVGTPWTSASTFAQPSDSVDFASVDYEPMTRTWGSTRSGSSTRPVTGVTTGGSWMLALSPLLTLGLLALGWLLTEGGTSSSTSIIGMSLGAVLLAWVIVATIADYRRLGALGHEYRPSVLWLLLGPLLYLIARAIHVVRTTGRGAAPTWVYAVLSIVLGAALGATSFFLPREAGLTELRAVETTIVADLQQQGLDYSVICPDTATLSVGSTFVCTAYDEVGPALLLRVSYGGVPGSFSYNVESSNAGA